MSVRAYEQLSINWERKANSRTFSSGERARAVANMDGIVRVCARACGMVFLPGPNPSVRAPLPPRRYESWSGGERQKYRHTCVNDEGIVCRGGTDTDGYGVCNSCVGDID